MNNPAEHQTAVETSSGRLPPGSGNLEGNTLLVNGIRSPWHEVSTRWYRLRMLNGSNARILDFSFSDDSSFYVIGSDGDCSIVLTRFLR